ncbi:MAG: type II secretion system major pseudopilin GspG [Planctomycetes bacterium]|nr:type II secretion system major pseudopilin GspG [Planctomycetota bacterium]
MKGTHNKKQRRGFTMIELMAVLIIMGLLFAVVANNFMGQTDKARKITTKANLKLLHDAVKSFKMDTGRYPDDEEGLSVLIDPPMDVQSYQEGGYLDRTELPVDGWGNDFEYIRYPESGKPFVIRSFGADNQEGGEGFDADLLSTDR